MDTFSQITVLGSSMALLCAFIVLWRRGVPAYIAAFTWQSVILVGVTGTVASFSGDRRLYVVAVLLVGLKVIFIPRLLSRMEARFGGERERQPYVNTTASLLVATVLVIVAYVRHPAVAGGQ